MAHDPQSNLGHNAPYTKTQKSVYRHTMDKIKMKRFWALRPVRYAKPRKNLHTAISII